MYAPTQTHTSAQKARTHRRFETELAQKGVAVGVRDSAPEQVHTPPQKMLEKCRFSGNAEDDAEDHPHPEDSLGRWVQPTRRVTAPAPGTGTGCARTSLMYHARIRKEVKMLYRPCQC